MIGQRIRELRKSKNLTQTQFGEIFNVGKSTVSQWETGVNEPDAKTIETVANEFGVSIDYIYGRPSKGLSEEPDDSQVECETDFSTLEEWVEKLEAGLITKGGKPLPDWKIKAIRAIAEEDTPFDDKQQK